MIRFLDGLVMLREIDTISGVKKNSNQLRREYPNDIVIVNHIAYIFRDRLCELAREKATNLDGFVQLGDLTEYLGCHKKIFRDRFKFMEDSGVELFRTINLCGVRMIHLDDEHRRLMYHYRPCVLSLKDGKFVTDMKLLGDIKIGYF